MELQATGQKYITADDIPDLYRKYLKEILSFIYGYVRDAEETKDLAQDVFYKLWKDVEKKNIPDVNIRGYIYKIAQLFRDIYNNYLILCLDYTSF